MTEENKPEEQPRQTHWTLTRSWLVYEWQCGTCEEINHISYNTTRVYGFIVECTNCESVYKIKDCLI